jgi:hypothetical protein
MQVQVQIMVRLPYMETTSTIDIKQTPIISKTIWCVIFWVVSMIPSLILSTSICCLGCLPHDMTHEMRDRIIKSTQTLTHKTSTPMKNYQSLAYGCVRK